MTTIRLYGHTVRKWFRDDGTVEQYEVAYCDYSPAGELVGTGTEDFSPVRWKYQTQCRSAHAWCGKHRNDGSKSFEYLGLVKFRKGAVAADLKTVIRVNRCRDALEIQLRCC